MIINTHNYEEYFLLYVDNELSATERAAVENFARQHPGLAEELEMLQQATLSNNEAVVFDNKEALIKKGMDINVANCETYFLLYTDNELDNTARHQVERFVLQHPATQENFTLLQQTRLTPEDTVFEHKHRLYKKASGRVIPLQWMKVGVAAVLIGLAVLVYVWGPTSTAPVGNRQPSIAQNKKTTPVAPEAFAAKQANSHPLKETNGETQQDTSAGVYHNEYAVQKAPMETPSARANNIVLEHAVAVETVKGRQSTVPAPYAATEATVVDVADNTDTHLNDVAMRVPRNLTPSNTLIKNAAATTDEPPAVGYQQAVFKELNTSEEEDNSILFGNTRLNKNKLRGLLKKASSIINKKGESGEEETPVRVASFELKGK